MLSKGVWFVFNDLLLRDYFIGGDVHKRLRPNEAVTSPLCQSPCTAVLPSRLYELFPITDNRYFSGEDGRRSPLCVLQRIDKQRWHSHR